MFTSGPGALLLMIVFGTALLFCASILFSGDSRISTLLRRLTVLAGWLCILVGNVSGLVLFSHWFSLLTIFILVATIWRAFLSHRRSERQMLAWCLAVAAERGVPLHHAAWAFAAEGESKVHRQAQAVGDLLSQGHTLFTAIDQACRQMPNDLRLAMRIGEPLGQLSQTLRSALAESRNAFAVQLRGVLEKMLYIAGVFIVGNVIFTFVVLKIVPVFEKMFYEFGLQLPTPTLFVFDSSGLVLNGMGFLLVLLGPAMGLGFFYYIGLFPRDGILIGRLHWPIDRAAVLRALAYCVRAEWPIPRALRLAAEHYPRVLVCQKLDRVAQQTEAGTDWLDALRVRGFVTRGEVALARSAQQAGNLAWILEELADAKLRKTAYWLRLMVAILFPVTILILGAATAVFVVGLFMPLVELITKLS